MDKEKKKKILISLIVIFGVILIAAGGYLVIKYLGLFQTGETYEKVRESYASSGSTAADTTGNETTKAESTSAAAENPIDFKSLRAENSDVYSWIEIPDTNVNYPVLQSSEDDNFYLDHDVYKNYSFPGAIYSQSMNKRDYSDRVTVLYGHNMLDGSMFADLHKFSDKDFFDSHKYFYVYTPTRKLTYEVVSAYEYDDRHIMNSFDFRDDKVLSEWLSAAQNPHSLYSNVRTDVKLDLNSKMLVLSTCLNSGDGRFILQGVLIKDEQTK